MIQKRSTKNKHSIKAGMLLAGCIFFFLTGLATMGIGIISHTNPGFSIGKLFQPVSVMEFMVRIFFK